VKSPKEEAAVVIMATIAPTTAVTTVAAY